MLKPAERRLIGCSDLAKVARAKPSRRSLYARIVEDIEVRNPALELYAECGHEFELPIARIAARKLGLDPDELMKPDTRLHHAGRLWGRYSLDLVHMTGTIIECKARSSWSFAAQGWGEEGTDDIPLREFLQIQGEMEAVKADRDHWVGTNIPDVDRVHVAVGLGNEVKVFVVHYQPDVAAQLVEACERFWRDFIVPHIRPPFDGSEDDEGLLLQQYPHASKELREPSEDEAQLVERYFAVAEQAERVAIEKERLKQSICSAVAGDLGLERPGAWRIRWADRSGKVADSKVLAELVQRYAIPDDELKALREQHRGQGFRIFEPKRYA